MIARRVHVDDKGEAIVMVVAGWKTARRRARPKLMQRSRRWMWVKKTRPCSGGWFSRRVPQCCGGEKRRQRLCDGGFGR